jgi:hypothetical protein
MKNIYNYIEYNESVKPRGWNWRQRFVDEEGNIYKKGVLQPEKQDKRPDFEDHYKELKRLYLELDKYRKGTKDYNFIMSLIEELEKELKKVKRDI